LGIAIAAPIGSIIGAYVSLNLVMTLMVVPFFIATLISITLREPNHDLEKKKSESYLTIIKSGFYQLKKSRILIILSFELILTDVAVFFLIWLYQLYLEALQLQLIFFGFISASITLILIILNNVVIKLENRYNNKHGHKQD